MRIITGTARGRVLRAPKGLGTRPMLDAQKQMLFDVLRDRVVVPGVWDIFAGSGGLGLEALSRGAEQATFVERGREAAECLASNIEVCHFSAEARIVRADAFRLDFERLGHDAQLVFLDPPFPCFADARADLENLLLRLSSTPRFQPGGLLIWRLPDDATNVAFPAALELTDRRETGRSVIEIYRRRA